jgi:hypothetical protein
MTERRPIPALRDPDLVNAEIALERAARRARERARRAGIPVAYWKDGEVRKELLDNATEEESPVGGPRKGCSRGRAD